MPPSAARLNVTNLYPHMREQINDGVRIGYSQHLSYDIQLVVMS